MSEHNNAGTPLSRKLLMLGALPAVVMFITLIGFFTSARLEDARRDLSDSNQLLADSLAPSLEYAVVSGNKMALQEILTKSIRYSTADWVRVTDVTGAQIGRASRTSNEALEIPVEFQVYGAASPMSESRAHSGRNGPRERLFISLLAASRAGVCGRFWYV